MTIEDIATFIQIPEITAEERTKCAALIREMWDAKEGFQYPVPGTMGRQIRRMSAMYFAGKRDGVEMARRLYTDAIKGVFDTFDDLASTGDDDERITIL